MPLVSSISRHRSARLVRTSSRVSVGLTQRCMLEGKCDDILDPFYWIGRRISRKALADDNFDASHIVVGVPMVLV